MRYLIRSVCLPCSYARGVELTNGRWAVINLSHHFQTEELLSMHFVISIPQPYLEVVWCLNPHKTFVVSCAAAQLR